VTVAGILSQGSSSCRGKDTYISILESEEWLYKELDEYSHVVKSSVLTEPCIDNQETDRCFGNLSYQCVADTFSTDMCELGCGWNGIGYGCTDVETECKVDQAGRCVGETAQWCEQGTLFSENCSVPGKACTFSQRFMHAACVVIWETCSSAVIDGDLGDACLGNWSCQGQCGEVMCLNGYLFIDRSCDTDKLIKDKLI